MINKVILVGRLTKEIELKKTNSNTSYCRFNVACSRRFKSKQEGAPDADFISCIAWNQSAEFLSKYATKGAIVGVEGRITTGSYDKNGQKVYTTDVTAESVRLIGSSNGASRQKDESTNKTFTPSSEPSFSDGADDSFSNTPSLEISQDDLPFY